MPQEIAGRDEELALARSWLAQPGAGALVFTGEPGIGKTTLWQWCVDDAARSGVRVLSCSPAEAETDLPYAALGDLLTPALDDLLAGLPARQRRALEAALVLGDDRSVLLDERAVAFATLTALRTAGSSQMLVVAVDDVQWLDRSSAIVLAYALRRVAGEENVRAILTRRIVRVDVPSPVVDAFPAELVETVHVGPLSLGALHRAIRTALGTPLSRPTLVRVHESSGGRPLHALELARAIGRTSGDVPGSGVDELLRRRVAGLPPAARDALLVAAATTDPSLASLDAFLGGSAEEMLGPAVDAGLVRIAGRDVRLAHPLLADAVVADAGAERVAAVHRALAETARTVEERAVHLARASRGPDASLASSLDAAVFSARARGAPTTAADLAVLAADVTPREDEGERLGRLLEAADAAYVAGDVERAKSLLESVAAEQHPLRYRAQWRLGVVLGDTGAPGAIVPLREALGTEEPALASAVHRSIAQLLLYTGDVLSALEHGQAGLDAARQSGSTSELAYSLGVLALAKHVAGEDDWRHTLDLALEQERSSSLPDLDLSPSAVAADLYRLSLDLEPAAEAYTRILDAAAERQDVRLEVWAGFGLAQVAFLSGRLRMAGNPVRELFDLAEQTGIMRVPAARCLAQYASLTGATDEARRLLAGLVAECEEHGELLNLRATLVIEGQLELSLDRPAPALDAFRRARGIAEEQHVSPGSLVLPLADEIEALALAGETDEAARLAPTLESIELSWAVPVAARASGLVAAARGEMDAAVTALRAAVADEEDLPLPLEQARSWLAFGRTLRRARLRGEARSALEEARGRFEDAGAVLWAAQATRDLARLGRRSPKNSGLTPTEHRVAALVAEGRSNKEVAATLFLSVKTVEVSLTRVYKKLGVRGRGELAARQDELLKQ